KPRSGARSIEMAEKNSVLVRTSRYVSGGETEVSSRALEWWERASFSLSTDDTLCVVDQRFEHRLDLIASFFLGDPRLWWVIAQYNSILDPYAEIVQGLELRVPSTTKVNLILSGKTGGV